VRSRAGIIPAPVEAKVFVCKPKRLPTLRFSPFAAYSSASLPAAVVLAHNVPIIWKNMVEERTELGAEQGDTAGTGTVGWWRNRETRLEPSRERVATTQRWLAANTLNTLTLCSRA
jgi:hypothetical protein